MNSRPGLAHPANEVVEHRRGAVAPLGVHRLCGQVAGPVLRQDVHAARSQLIAEDRRIRARPSNRERKLTNRGPVVAPGLVGCVLGQDRDVDRSGAPLADGLPQRRHLLVRQRPFRVGVHVHGCVAKLAGGLRQRALGRGHRTEHEHQQSGEQSGAHTRKHGRR